MVGQASGLSSFLRTQESIPLDGGLDPGSSSG